MEALTKSPERQSLIVVTGPTACGKSELAVKLAVDFGGEIVNADSVQIYRFCDIGASQPSRDMTERVSHHLYSFLEPDEIFSAGDYRRLAAEKIAELCERSVLPVITGGSGLYIRSLLCGLVDAGDVPQAIKTVIEEKELKLRAELGEEQVAVRMHKWLESIDSESAAKIDVSDLHRQRRAIGVKLATGRSLAELQRAHANQERPYRALIVALFPGRSALYERIDRRVDKMLKMGLVEEVRALRFRYPLSIRPFTAIGYRHVNQYLDGILSFSEMAEVLRRDTRRFAKRQITWWRNQSRKLGFEPISLSAANLLHSEKEIPGLLNAYLGRFLARESEFGSDGIWYMPICFGCKHVGEWRGLCC